MSKYKNAKANQKSCKISLSGNHYKHFYDAVIFSYYV